MARDQHAIFERIISNMQGVATIEDLVNPRGVLSKEGILYIPLRYRIIALGFEKHYTLQKLNAMLEENRCPRLYLRNFWEATLIYAFLKGYSYAEWKRLQAQCADIYDSVEKTDWFSKKITYDELERYVLQNSKTAGDALYTKTHTALLEEKMMSLSDSLEEFRAFLLDNVQSFSTARERARYYFCKYLYFYLNAQIERYFAAVRRGRGVKAALSALMPLKVVTVLRKHKTWSEEKKREYIQSSTLSSGVIFDEFNYFFYGYVSLDWVEVLMECYPDVKDIPAKLKRRIATIFRKNRPDFAKLSDDEVIHRRTEEAEQSMDQDCAKGGNPSYNKNRSGEHAVYKYIQGTLDIDRTALICFLLFFAAKSGTLPSRHRLTPDRLQEIVRNCGYSPLDIENDFDWFALEFLEAERPASFLTELMSEYAHHSENSFLYHLYNNSINYADEIARIMAPNSSERRPS